MIAKRKSPQRPKPGFLRILTRIFRWSALVFGVVIAILIAKEFLPVANTHPLVDSQNRIVIYHGLNVANHSKSSPGRIPQVAPEEYEQMREWGFNLVRYLVFWEAIEPVPGQIDEEYLTRTWQEIDVIGSVGLEVVIDIHQDLFAQRFGGNGFPDWAVNDGGRPFTRQEPWQNNYWQPAVWHSYDFFWRSDALQNQYANAVRAVLAGAANRPHVIGLDIMNEPWPWKGLGFEKLALSKFYKKVAAMRDYSGFQTPLFFAPMLPTNAGLSSGLREAPGERSVYAPHLYDAFIDAGWTYRPWNHLLMQRAVKLRIREARRMKVPLLFGEFGLDQSNPGFARYLRDFTELMDEYQLSWAYWSYDRGPFGVLDTSGAPGPALKELVYVYPQRVAGRNLRFKRTGQTFEMTFDPVDCTGPTEVFVPLNLDVEHISLNGTDLRRPVGPILVLPQPADSERQRLLVRWR